MGRTAPLCGGKHVMLLTVGVCCCETSNEITTKVYHLINFVRGTFGLECCRHQKHCFDFSGLFLTTRNPFLKRNAVGGGGSSREKQSVKFEFMLLCFGYKLNKLHKSIQIQSLGVTLYKNSIAQIHKLTQFFCYARKLKKHQDFCHNRLKSRCFFICAVKKRKLSQFSFETAPFYEQDMRFRIHHRH